MFCICVTSLSLCRRYVASVNQALVKKKHIASTEKKVDVSFRSFIN